MLWKHWGNPTEERREVLAEVTTTAVVYVFWKRRRSQHRCVWVPKTTQKSTQPGVSDWLLQELCLDDCRFHVFALTLYVILTHSV